MLIFIPYSTDAPIYYLPISTCVLIVANIAVFIAMVTGGISDPTSWILIYGTTLTPLQWLTSMFAHQDLLHLLGNMVFLWIFGLIIEGKLGWWKFLLCYLFIGVVQSVGEQTLMLFLGDQGGSLGASSAIFGILAMAAIWAPKNDISVFYWFGFIAMGTGEIPVMMFAAFYIVYEAILALILGFHSSSWLHVGGIMVGAPLAIILLKSGIVDCEGWDIFHVWRGETGESFGERKQPIINDAQVRHLQQQRESSLLAGADEQIVTYLQNGNPEAAYKLLRKLGSVGEGVKLSREALITIVAWLHRHERWEESCPLLAEIVARFPAESERIQLKLAQICIVQLHRPGKALDLLKLINPQRLTPELLGHAKKLVRRAKQMQHEGIVELDDDLW